MPKVSVIVPFCNNRKTLPRCLAALRRQTIPLELIFVDDGSTDGGGELLAAERDLKLLRQANAGPAAARNRGVTSATGDIILFTDADCEPEPAWAAALVNALNDPAISGAKGVYRTQQKSLAARFVQIEYQEKYRYMARFATIDFIDTYSAAFRRNVFAQHRFDESFPLPSVEDQEFSFRLAAAGHRFIFCPQAVVVHQHADTAKSYLRKKFKIGFWKAKILRAMPERGKGDTHTPGSLKLQMLILPFAVAALLAALHPRMPLWPAIALNLVFLASMGGLFRQALRHDPLVMAVIPGYCALRAIGLSSGLLLGLITPRFSPPNRR